VAVTLKHNAYKNTGASITDMQRQIIRLPKAKLTASLIFAALLSLSLGGCGTVTGTNVTREVGQEIQPPPPPDIIYGPNARLWVSNIYVVDIDGELEAWNKTGLFASVTTTSSRTPPLDGVLIDETCYSAGELDSQSFFGTFQNLLTFLTVGVIPRLHTTDYLCHLELYQNGQLVGKNLFGYQEFTLDGWLALAYNGKETRKMESRMRVNNLLSHMGDKRHF
jgi:hypothetical protein